MKKSIYNFFLKFWVVRIIKARNFTELRRAGCDVV